MSNGPLADVLILNAAHAGASSALQISVLAVPVAAAGVRVDPITGHIGMRDAPMARITLDDVRLPKDLLLGRPGQGLGIVLSAMRWERSCILAGMLGAADRDLVAVTGHLKSRRNSRGPLAAMQSVSHALAEIRLDLELARLMLYRAAGALDGAALRRRVRGLTGWMMDAGASRGDRVALCLPKGPCAVIGQLAAFAAGAVAVPLDSQAPAVRLRDMLSDLEPALVITSAKPAEWIGDTGQSILVDPDDPDTLPQADRQDMAPPDPDDAALILMTAGSTGRPKGVVLSHRNITAFIDWAIAAFALQAYDSLLNLAPLHFDLSLLDICASQRVGARVHLLPDGKAGFAQEVMRAPKDHSVTVLYTVPTQLRLLVGLRAFERSRPDALR